MKCLLQKNKQAQRAPRISPLSPNLSSISPFFCFVSKFFLAMHGVFSRSFCNKQNVPIWIHCTNMHSAGNRSMVCPLIISPYHQYTISGRHVLTALGNFKTTSHSSMLTLCLIIDDLPPAEANRIWHPKTTGELQLSPQHLWLSKFFSLCIRKKVIGSWKFHAGIQVIFLAWHKEWFRPAFFV